MLALELQTRSVLGLAAVRATSLRFLIPTQAGAQLDVDAGRGREAEALGDLDQVELVHVEDGAEGVGGVGLKV